MVNGYVLDKYVVNPKNIKQIYKILNKFCSTDISDDDGSYSEKKCIKDLLKIGEIIIAKDLSLVITPN